MDDATVRPHEQAYLGLHPADETEPDLFVEEETDDFSARVAALVKKQKDNPDVTLQMNAEMYIFLTDFEQAMRTMQMNGGPMAMLKGMMGRG